jgi:PmbA protein
MAAMKEKAVLDTVLEVLRAGGAEGDAWLEERRSLELRVREGRLEDVLRADVRGLAVRAMREGKLGFVHTSTVDADGARRAAERALELGRAAGTRDDLELPAPAGPGDGSDEGAALALFDSAVGEHAIDEKVEWARAAEAAGRAVDPRIKRGDGAAYGETLVGRWIANTKGLYRHYRRSHLEVGVEVIAEDGGELQPGGHGVEAVRFADLPAPEAVGRRAGERAVGLFGGRPVATGRYPVVWSPEAGFALLVRLAVALRGDHLSRKRSWLAGRDAAAIGSPLVTIHDDQRRRGGVASAPFDAEGVDTQDVVLVDRGTVAGGLLDLACARRLEKTSTGNAHREGYEALPEIGSSNLFLLPGERSAGEIIGEVERGLWVWGLSGWWIGMDPANPEFSSAAFGLWIEQGKPAQPVARVSVAGSMEAILGGIDAVANDLVLDRSTKTPTFRVRELAVSGT